MGDRKNFNNSQQKGKPYHNNNNNNNSYNNNNNNGGNFYNNNNKQNYHSNNNNNNKYSNNNYNNYQQAPSDGKLIGQIIKKKVDDKELLFFVQNSVKVQFKDAENNQLQQSKNPEKVQTITDEFFIIASIEESVIQRKDEFDDLIFEAELVETKETITKHREVAIKEVFSTTSNYKAKYLERLLKKPEIFKPHQNSVQATNIFEAAYIIDSNSSQVKLNVKGKNYNLDYDKNYAKPPKNRDPFRNKAFNRALHKCDVLITEGDKQKFRVLGITNNPYAGPNKKLLYGIVAAASQQEVSSKFKEAVKQQQQEQDVQQDVQSAISTSKNRVRFNHMFISTDNRLPAMEIVEIADDILKLDLLDHYVAAEYLDWPIQSSYPLVKITKCYGNVSSYTNLVKMYFDSTGIKNQDSFDPEVLESIEKDILSQPISKEVVLADPEEVIFTIDSESTFAIDDAVSVKKINANQWQIGVHIACASYHITEGTLLDKVMRERQQTIYVGHHHTNHLLPANLIEHISIIAQKERVVNSVYVNMDSNGSIDLNSIIIKKQNIVNGYRLSYTDVQQYINEIQQQVLNITHQKKPDFKLDPKLMESIKILYHLTQKLRQKRVQLGTHNEEIDQNKGEGDTEANQLVECLMTLSNMLVTHYINKSILKLDPTLSKQNSREERKEEENADTEEGGEDTQNTLNSALKGYQFLYRNLLSKVNIKLDFSSPQNYMKSKNKIFRDQQISITLQKYIQYQLRLKSGNLKELIFADPQKIQEAETQQQILSTQIGQLGQPSSSSQSGQQQEPQQLQQQQPQSQSDDYLQEVLDKDYLERRQEILKSICQEYYKIEECFLDMESDHMNSLSDMEELITHFYALDQTEQLKWTSPIRKYQDLLVNRMLDRIIREGDKQVDQEALKEMIQNFSEYLNTHSGLMQNMKYISRVANKQEHCTSLLKTGEELAAALITKINLIPNRIFVDVYVPKYDIETSITITTETHPNIKGAILNGEVLQMLFSSPNVQLSQNTAVDQQKSVVLSEVEEKKEEDSQQQHTQQQQTPFFKAQIQRFQIVAVSIGSTKHFPLDYVCNLYDPLNLDFECTVYARVTNIDKEKKEVFVKTFTLQQYEGSFKVEEEEEEEAIEQQYKVNQTTQVLLRLTNSYPVQFQILQKKKNKTI